MSLSIIARSPNKDIQFNTWPLCRFTAKRIATSKNPVEEYKQCVLSQSVTDIVAIHHTDDIFNECDPMSFCEVNYGKDHCDQFDLWISEHKNGYTIIFKNESYKTLTEDS